MALDLSVTALERLRLLRPAPSPGLRIPAADQTHLTLHFLGEGDAAQTGATLQSLSAPAFPLEIEGVGVFRSPTGAVTLWAGVRLSSELKELRSAISEALAPAGFRPEARPYAAHIALGRIESGATEAVVNDFLGRPGGFPRGGEPGTSFSLFSSVFVDGVPVYRREASYRLGRPPRES